MPFKYFRRHFDGCLVAWISYEHGKRYDQHISFARSRLAILVE